VGESVLQNGGRVWSCQRSLPSTIWVPTVKSQAPAELPVEVFDLDQPGLRLAVEGLGSAANAAAKRRFNSFSTLSPISAIAVYTPMNVRQRARRHAAIRRATVFSTYP
jgi:hypothetical protein